MEIDIICPLYNAEKEIIDLDNSLKMQNDVKIKNIKYILTESKDNTLELLKKISSNYSVIKKSEFSHSITREKLAFESTADIIVFITQDVIINDENWLSKLTNPIINNECEATFSRQLCDNNSIEKYTRESNYPNESYINSKKDIEKKGLKTFFFSDAACAINRKIFVELNGYDNKNLPISEDMYFAFKLIMNGYKIKYCADSEVIHSHDFSLKQYYERYKLTGMFFKQNSYLDKYGTNKSGGNLAKYILKRAIQDKNLKVIMIFLPNMLVRFIGMKIGKMKG